MNANPSAASGAPSTQLMLTRALDITGVFGDTGLLLDTDVGTVWRKNISEVFSAPFAHRILDCIEAGEGRSGVVGDGRGGELLMSARRDGAGRDSGYVVEFWPMAAELEWLEREEAALRTDGQMERDEFLDEAALAFARNEAGMTTIAVEGGLDHEADARFGRILQEEAIRQGGLRTSRFGNATYGVLHQPNADSSRLVGAIARTARDEGVIDQAAVVGSESISNDASGISPDEIRATLAYSTGGLGNRLKSGLRKVGLLARRDEARESAEQMIDRVRSAVASGSMIVESRPVLSLRQNAVAMREVRCHPVVDGRPVDVGVLDALAEAPGLLREIESANVGRALDMQADMKLWKAVSLRVLVSMRASALEDEKLMRAVKKGIGQRGISAGKLLICPFRPLSGDMAGEGDALLQRSMGEDWRMVVSDFYTFIKADQRPSAAGSKAGEINAYIRVGSSRLLDLQEQKDGEFLLKELVRTWRSHGIELIATGVDRDSDFALLERIGVRYARGEKVGGWQRE